eukprot:COSAG02_NODE_21304_length_794_cov_0.831655_2_plen_114_part_01
MHLIQFACGLRLAVPSILAVCGMQNSLMKKGVDNYVFIELKCLHTTHSRPLLLPDDKINPIKALQFAEMKEDIIYGKDLGTVVGTQASQLWLVVARGNVESMLALSMGTLEASL